MDAKHNDLQKNYAKMVLQVNIFSFEHLILS